MATVKEFLPRTQPDIVVLLIEMLHIVLKTTAFCTSSTRAISISWPNDRRKCSAGATGEGGGGGGGEVPCRQTQMSDVAPLCIPVQSEAFLMGYGIVCAGEGTRMRDRQQSMLLLGTVFRDLYHLH